MWSCFDRDMMFNRVLHSVQADFEHKKRRLLCGYRRHCIASSLLEHRRTVCMWRNEIDRIMGFEKEILTTLPNIGVLRNVWFKFDHQPHCFKIWNASRHPAQRRHPSILLHVPNKWAGGFPKWYLMTADTLDGFVYKIHFPIEKGY